MANATQHNRVKEDNVPTKGTKSAAKKPLPKRSASPSIWKLGYQPSKLNAGDLVVDPQLSRLDIANSAGTLTQGHLLVPGAAVANVAGTVPAGGAGAAAGAWDTAANRDTAITTMTETRTQLNALLARLRSQGVISS